MDSAKADIERFVRQHADKCVTANGRVNARPVQNINDLHLGGVAEFVAAPAALGAQPPSAATDNNENQPYPAQHNTSNHDSSTR